MNKKGMIDPLTIGILLLIAIVATATAAVATGKFNLGLGVDSLISESIDSFSPVEENCKPTPLTMKISGTLDIADERTLWDKALTNIFTMNPEPYPKKISNLNYYSQQLSIFDTSYQWKICPVNPTTNNLAGKCSEGNELFEFVDGYLNKIESQEFSVYTTVPDQNCNGVIDEDFDIKLVATIEVDDNEFDTKTLSQVISFVNGVVQE